MSTNFYKNVLTTNTSNLVEKEVNAIQNLNVVQEDIKYGKNI